MKRETRWSPGTFAAFEVFFRPYMKRCIDNIYVRGEENIPKDKAVLVLANHVSWWDGFLLREIHRGINQDLPYWSLARQELVEENPFLRQIGVVGFDSTSTASLRKLKSFVEDRANIPGAWFVLYPQGEIWPSSIRPLRFHKGATWLRSILSGAITIPVGIHLESLNKPKPSAFISFGHTVDHALKPELRLLEKAVEDELDYISGTLEKEGERSFAFWEKNYRQVWS